jgi:MoaA/NifB/PqqE/SkfB family radical SAM enzyme
MKFNNLGTSFIFVTKEIVMMPIRDREKELQEKYSKNKLSFGETTYHFSEKQKEEAFVDAQFPDPEDKKRYRTYREEWHRRSDECDPGPQPLAVICELASACNLQCTMCYTITPEFQESVVGAQRVMPWDTVVRIVDECAEIGVYSILFSWRGESPLYKSKGSDGIVHDFADVLAYAREKGILEVTSLANGRSFAGKLMEKVVDAQPNWISFSIDGLGDAYNKIRRSISSETKDPFDTVIANLKEMIAYRDKLGYTRPQIRTNSIYPSISQDPEAYRTFMEGIGVGLVTVNELMDFRGAELPEDAILDDWYCTYPFQRLVVSANGVVLPCPGAHNEEEELVLGRYVGSPIKRTVKDGQLKTHEYHEISLKDAWHSEDINKIRELHKENRRKEIWACKHCRHGAKKHGAEWIPEDWNQEKMEWTDRAWRE